MATQALAANGAKVYICGRRKEALDRVVEVYSPQVEGQIIALPGDVTNKDDIKRLAEEIRQREGGLHILVRPWRSSFLAVSLTRALPHVGLADVYAPSPLSLSSRRSTTPASRAR